MNAARFTLVTASAGSGKTHRLTQEIVDAIRSGIRPGQMIVTTFTKKAAAELRERTRTALTDAGLVQEASELDAALIGTVNSVAGKLVEMFAIDAGMSPRLRVLGEHEQDGFFALALDAVIAGIEHERASATALKRLGYDSDVTQDDTTRYSRRSKRQWIADVETMVSLARSNAITSDELLRHKEVSRRELIALMDAVQPESTDDPREQWFLALEDAVAVLNSEIDSVSDNGEYNAAKARRLRDERKQQDHARKVIARQSHSKAVRNARELERLTQHVREKMDTDAGISWSEWIRIGRGRYAFEGGTAADLGVPAKSALSDLLDLIAHTLLGSRLVREDMLRVHDLIFDTAAEALTTFRDYKRRLGVMDFVDQESLALDILTHPDTAAEVGRSIASRFSFLAVDEFQDTSPIQLELFLRLGAWIPRKLWVGDPKQAIYGFRGAAPELMVALFHAKMREAAHDPSLSIGTLTHSYRSDGQLLGFTNALFTSIFCDPHGMNLAPNDVALHLPESRKERAERGEVRLWKPAHKGPVDESSRVNNSTLLREGIASNIRELLGESFIITDGKTGEKRPLEPRDIAVLSRTKSPIPGVVAWLRALGVPALGHTIDLTLTREGLLLRSALAYLADPFDTLALTELVHHIPEHRAHATWFEQIAAAQPTEQHDVFRDWADDPSLAELQSLRAFASHMSAPEIMAAVIESLELPERVRSWSRPEERLLTLQAFATLAVDYENDAVNRAEALSIPALADYVMRAASAWEPVNSPNAVTVTTIHQAKGLGFPVVVSMIPKNPHSGRSAVSVFTPESSFDPEHPLRERQIRLIPVVDDEFEPFETMLSHSAHVAADAARARDEETRIQYVSLTRAKHIQILASEYDLAASPMFAAGPTDDSQPRIKESPMQEVHSTQLCHEGGRIIAQADTDCSIVRIPGARVPHGFPGGDFMDDARPMPDGGTSAGQRRIPVTRGMRASAIARIDDAHLIHPDASISPYEPWQPQPSPFASVSQVQASARDLVSRAHEAGPRARVHASARTLADPTSISVEIHTYAQEYPVSTSDSWSLVGEAIHAYLALPLEHMDARARHAAAERLHARWLGAHPNLAQTMMTERIESIGSAWLTWTREQGFRHTARTEVPVALAYDNGQLMHGWIDSLLEDAQSRLILVDHKTFPSTDEARIAKKVREEYAGQLEAYAEALEASGRGWPHACLIHLPLSGRIATITLPRPTGRPHPRASE